MNNKQEYKLNLFKPSGEYMGELDVNNLALFLTREGFSNITFDIAAKIDNKTNKRLYDIYDQYEVELILRNKTYRFIITDTPANMNDDGSLTYSYTAVSTDFELTKKHIFHWEGIKKYTYWRRVDYKTAGQPFGPQIITPINLQKIDGVFDSQEVEIYEVRKTAEQERESLLVDMTGIELNHNQMGEGTFVILDEGGVAKAKIAPFSESRKEQIPLITEIYYKVYDKIAFADSSIEYNELLNKYQFDNAEFYSTPTGETKEFDGLLYQEEEYYTTIGVTIKDIVDGTIHKDTEWKVNINEDIAEEKRSDIEINNLNAYQLIETIAKSFDVVFVVDSSNREISFYKKYDDIPNTIQNNLVIDFQTYLKAISKDITTDEVVTNIIASGSDGISTTFVSPTGRNWENYDYYLDSYLMFREDGGFLEHNTNIETITDIKDLKFTYTKDFSSRWLSHGAAEKLSLWSITKDYFYRLLNNLPQRADTSKITGNDIYRNLAERREKLLKELVLNETKADQYYAQELHYKNLATIVDNEEIFNEEDLKDTNSETYARYLKQNERSANYLKISNENKLSKERFEKSIQELEYLTMGYHKEIYDSNPPRGTNVYKLMEDLRILFDKENPDQWNFTQKELKEIEKIKKDALWNDDSIDNEVDLFLAANDYLLENNKPKVTISIDIVDILAAAEVEIDKDNLFLGNYIYVRFEEFNIDTKAQISSLNINFEENTIDMEITTLKHFSKGIAHKIIQKINGLSVESKNITEYYKDYNKRSGEESKKLADIFGDDYNADTNTISGGGTGVDEKGNPVHDIVINGEGIKTSNMKIDAATDNIIIDTDAGTTIQLKNGMLGLVGKGKQGDQEIKTRVMMSTTQGFRIDVMKEDELGYQSVDNKFWADLNGNLTVKGRIYATGGKIGNLTITDNILEGVEGGQEALDEKIKSEEQRAKDAEAAAEKSANDAKALAEIAEKLAQEADELAREAEQAASKAAEEAGQSAEAAGQSATAAGESAEAAGGAKTAAEKADEKAQAAAKAAEDAEAEAEAAAKAAEAAKAEAEAAEKEAADAVAAAEEAAKAAEKAKNDLIAALDKAQIKGDRIAGWETAEYRFSANSTEGYGVSLDSGTIIDGVVTPYRIWAGAVEGKDAPFSVQYDGTVSASKLIIKYTVGDEDEEKIAFDNGKFSGVLDGASGEFGHLDSSGNFGGKLSGATGEFGKLKDSGEFTGTVDDKATLNNPLGTFGNLDKDGNFKGTVDETATLNNPLGSFGNLDKDGNFTGNVSETATLSNPGGMVAGLTLEQDQIFINNRVNNEYFHISTKPNDNRIEIGAYNSNETKAYFAVSKTGIVYAKGAEIEGKVTIDNGSIMIGGVQTSWFEDSKSGERYYYRDSFVIDGLTMYRWLSDEELDNGPSKGNYLLTETRNVGIGDVVWGFQMIDNSYYDDFNYPHGDPARRVITNVSKGHSYNFVVDENGVMFATAGKIGNIDIGNVASSDDVGGALSAASGAQQAADNAQGGVNSINTALDGSNIKIASDEIAGWTISNNAIKSKSTGTNHVSLASSGTWRIWAGGNTAAAAKFKVNQDGSIYASNAEIAGTINAQDGKIGDLYIDTLTNIRKINSGQSESDRKGLGFNTSYSYGGGTLKYFTGLDAMNLMLERESNDEGRISTHLSYYGIFVGRGAGSSATPWMSMDLWGLRSTGLMDLRSGGNLKLNAEKQLVLSTSEKGQIFLSNDDGKELTILRNPNPNGISWTGFSTKVIKENIQNFNTQKALNFIENMKIYEFDYKNSNKKGISFLIEDEIENNNKNIGDAIFQREQNSNIYIKELLPEWLQDQIGTDNITEYDKHHYSFNPLTFDFTSLNGVLIGAIKELSERVKILESKLNI